MKQLKKVLLVVFGFVFILSSCPSLLIIESAHAEGVPLYEEAREHFEQQGVLKNTTRGMDNYRIKRVELLKIVMENRGFIQNTREVPVPTPFKDVPANSWYAPYVQSAYRIGLYENAEYFEPEAYLTRLEAYKLILAIEGYSMPYEFKSSSPFKDVRTADEKRVVNKVLELGITKPKTKIFFGINQFMTRREAIELVYKFNLIAEADQAIADKGKDEQTIVMNVTKSNIKNIEYLESVRDQLFHKYLYIDEVEEEDLMDQAIRGYVDAVGDKYTVYFPPVESKDMNEFLDGTFTGIGAFLEMTDKGVMIRSPIVGSPAEKSGVKPYDIVKVVDGVDVSGMTLNEVVQLVKGPQGTVVEIVFEREGNDITIKVTRDIITVPSVSAEVKDDILIISLYQFSGNTSIQFSDIIEEHYSPEIRGIIIDMRSNPGGFTDVAEDILSYWVPEGEATLIIKFKGLQQKSFSPKNQMLTGVKTAILQNKSSASSAEIVSGTMKDYGKARIFGEASFGKGTVQEIIQYTNGASLKVTVAEWLTGKGNTIEGVGVIPDVEVVDNELSEEDEVLESAITWIRR